MLTPSPFLFLIVPPNQLKDHLKSEISITLSTEALGIVGFVFLNMACIGLRLYYFVSLRFGHMYWLGLETLQFVSSLE
ncbi:hypothetical protein F383_18748 [Gossypium arboreum]|uniref:Uncharacterized protein n=1 Tax=Gossypium arboreum TaxID=29729 RepID=A0A0B0NMD6_GOSAR|nr:hypothetical protein F383_18748 [Gossypium arboreum]